MQEVIRNAPAELTKGQRLVLLVCAFDFNDQTRAGWPGDDLLTKGTGMTSRGVRKAIEGLVELGVVERVPLGHDKTGAPIYAHAGRRARFRIREVVHRPLKKAEPGFPLSAGERRHQRAEKAAPASRKAAPGFPRPVISSQRSSQSARATADDLSPVIEAVEDMTGKTIDGDHAARIVRQVLDGRAGIRDHARYAAAAIRQDPKPQRFLPTPQPPPYQRPDLGEP